MVHTKKKSAMAAILDIEMDAFMVDQESPFQSIPVL